MTTSSNADSDILVTELVQEFSSQFTLTDEDVQRLLEAEKGWQNKYRRIMLIGKDLPVLPQELKSDDFLVQGCESNVWLTHFWQDEDQNPTLRLAASSDAKIVKGLVAIVLAAFNNKTKQQIQAFDVSQYLESLALLDELSASRGNGIKAIIDAIRSF